MTRPLYKEPGVFTLLRHGETQTKDIFRGRFDDALSDTGEEQMLKAVAGYQWDMIVASPLSRCRHFAQDLARKRQLNVAIDDRLTEYDFGDWDGKVITEVMAQDEQAVVDFFDDPFNHTPPGAESFGAFHDRVIDSWQSVMQQHAESAVLFVTHGGVIMSILADILGLDRIHGRVDVPYASVSRVRLGNDRGRHRLLSHG